jgi:PD-(D/E)XK nuclease superfamily
MHPPLPKADRLSGEVIGAAIEHVLPVHKAQLLSYRKLLNRPLRLLFNFHEVKLVEGISRLILPGANYDRRGEEAKKSAEQSQFGINARLSGTTV